MNFSIESESASKTCGPTSKAATAAAAEVAKVDAAAEPSLCSQQSIKKAQTQARVKAEEAVAKVARVVDEASVKGKADGLITAYVTTSMTGGPKPSSQSPPDVSAQLMNMPAGAVIAMAARLQRAELPAGSQAAAPAPAPAT